MASTLYNKELLTKYDLPKETVIDAVCLAVSRTLSKAMKTKVFAQESDTGIEIYALKHDMLAEDPVIRIRPETIKNKLLRHIEYSVERELHARKVVREFDRYCDLQSQMVSGTITKILPTGDLFVELERELLFERITLHACCPLRYQPVHEREKYKVDESYLFHVCKIRPIEVQGMPRLDIRLDRTSPRIPEHLIRVGLHSKALGLDSEKNEFKCTRRVCGAYSEIEAEKRIDKEIIQSVSRSLKENIFVKFGARKNVR